MLSHSRNNLCHNAHRRKFRTRRINGNLYFVWFASRYYSHNNRSVSGYKIWESKSKHSGVLFSGIYFIFVDYKNAFKFVKQIQHNPYENFNYNDKIRNINRFNYHSHTIIQQASQTKF